MESVPRRHRAPVAGALVAFLLAGCATFTCEPVTVVVARKEERVRLDTTPGGVRETETGRVKEVERMARVREFWVQSETGSWYRVSAEQLRAAEIGRPMEVCR